MTAQPIMPDRFDTGPAEFDESNKAAAAEFRRRALLSGHAVAAEDGVTILRPKKGRTSLAIVQDEEETQATPPQVERVIDLGADNEPRLIHIQTRDGHRHTLEVMITVESARLQSWYLDRMNEIRAKIALSQDEAEVQELAERFGMYQEKQVHLSIPNLPPDFLGHLSTHKFGQLMETVNLMLTADQEASPSPNGRTVRS